MSDDEQLEQALAELGDVVRCRCHEAYRDRDLQDPQCHCDSADALKVVIARIEELGQRLEATKDKAEAAIFDLIAERYRAEAKVEALERDKREAALDALAAMGQAQEAYEAQLKAEAKVEQLEREAILDAKLLADTQALLDTLKEQVEAERDATTRLLAAAGDGLRLMARAEAAEAKLAEVTAERDALEVENAILRVDRAKAMKAVEAGVAALEESGRKRGETEALLDKAVVAMREASSFLWHMTNAIDDEDYKGPHDGFNVPLVCHVQPYHDLHVEQLKTQAEKVDAVLAEIEGGKKDE